MNKEKLIKMANKAEPHLQTAFYGILALRYGIRFLKAITSS